MDSKPKKKMIILGLDNAGKSTILLTLKKQLSVQSFVDLSPTKGIVTENFESHDAIYYIWDFGGQDIYRKGYLKKPDNFKGTDVLIYVIDIQDPSRYEAALQYLEKILEIMKDLEQTCEYSIFFHKFDPDLLESKEYQKRSSDLRAKLRALFQKYAAPLKVYHTSVYTVFQRIQVM
jgi:GTPase SAR1 family protein